MAETKRQVGFLLVPGWHCLLSDVEFPRARPEERGDRIVDALPLVSLAVGLEEQQPRGGLVDPVYTLIRESPEALTAAVNALVEKYIVTTDATELLAEQGLSEPVETSPAVASFWERVAEYKRLCMRVDSFWQDRDNSRAERTSALLIRSQYARLAVLLRSEGHCQNPRCTGEIQDRTDKGSAILEVDHFHDLALGGPDDPSQMITLCPNCHAIKTRGSTRHGLKKVLLKEASRRHDELSEP